MTKDTRIIVWMLIKRADTTYGEWVPMLDYFEQSATATFDSRKILQATNKPGTINWMPKSITYSIYDNNWWMVGQPVTGNGTVSPIMDATSNRGALWRIERGMVPLGC